MANWKEKQDFDTTGGMVPGKKYADWQVEKFADAILLEETRRELCRKCGKMGDETGVTEVSPQFNEDSSPVLDEEGNQLVVDYVELECGDGHRWYKGEGRRRGIDGKNPILFESHLADRKRREIYTTLGTPDPSIVSGLYNRSHPQGRKVNTPEQRKASGTSYYRLSIVNRRMPIDKAPEQLEIARLQKNAYMREYTRKNKEKKRVVDAEYYRKNRERLLDYQKQYGKDHPEKIKARYDRYRAESREIIRKAKDVPCEDCNRRYPSACMHFHHIDPAQKLGDVGSMKNTPSRVVKEISKCAVICANCHAIRHGGDHKGDE